MRIGNHYPLPVAAPGEPASPRSKPAHQSLQSTTDLIAMSVAMTGSSPLQSADAAREARVQQLAQAWRSGAYRPDPQRIADKLLGWGFDGGPAKS